MNTTICSISLIVPVRDAAGTASALRIESGSAVIAAAAPADEATVCRKRRRLFEVMVFSPSLFVAGGIWRQCVVAPSGVLSDSTSDLR
jgi:hypothetical protein